MKERERVLLSNIEVPEMPETILEKFNFSLVSEVPELPGTLLEKFKFSLVSEVPEMLEILQKNPTPK